MKTRKGKSLVWGSTVIALLLAAVPAWSTFVYYYADPLSDTNGWLGETGTSDAGATAWTYARYYGPPAAMTYATTRTWPLAGGEEILNEYDWAERTYISTGALFYSNYDDTGFSYVVGDPNGQSSAIVSQH